MTFMLSGKSMIQVKGGRQQKIVFRGSAMVRKHMIRASDPFKSFQGILRANNNVRIFFFWMAFSLKACLEVIPRVL